ncbi:MAG: SLC13 family permease [Pseudomonadales bacterium]
MAVELALILGLVIVLVLPMLTDLNVGIVAFVVAFLGGTWLLDLSAADILAGFPDQMFLLLVGVTLLLATAQLNGTVDWVVTNLVSLANGRLAALPWVLFATALLTSSMGPGAAPALFVIGVGFIRRYGLNPLLVAAMIIHGNQSGAYSPVAPYGVVIGQLAESSQLTYSAVAMYLGVIGFHIALAAVVYFTLGGGKLIGMSVPATTGAAGEAAERSATPLQYATLLGFLALLIGVLIFQINMGFLALLIAFALLLFSSREHRQQAVNDVAWSVVLIITGVLTYVNLMQSAGATDWLAMHIGSMGSSVIIGLLLCLLVAVVTGVASTMGTIGMLVPLSAPFVHSGTLDATGLLTAMAISAAVTDISPFSTYGALFIATAASVLDKDALLKSQLKYTLCILAIVPMLAWLIFVVPGAG